MRLKFTRFILIGLNTQSLSRHESLLVIRHNMLTKSKINLLRLFFCNLRQRLNQEYSIHCSGVARPLYPVRNVASIYTQATRKACNIYFMLVTVSLQPLAEFIL